MRRSTLLLVVVCALLAGCGSSSPAPAPAKPSAPAADDASPKTPAITNCEDACTEYAMCAEEVYGEEFTHGGACVSACEERAPEEQVAYFTCLGDAETCTAMVDC
jgi:hypothetical protein